MQERLRANLQRAAFYPYRLPCVTAGAGCLVPIYRSLVDIVPFAGLSLFADEFHESIGITGERALDLIFPGIELRQARLVRESPALGFRQVHVEGPDIILVLGLTSGRLPFQTFGIGAPRYIF